MTNYHFKKVTDLLTKKNDLRIVSRKTILDKNTVRYDYEMQQINLGNYKIYVNGALEETNEIYYSSDIYVFLLEVKSKNGDHYNLTSKQRFSTINKIYSKIKEVA